MLSWNQLSLYESTDLVREAFKARHKRELNAGKSREIVSAIAQGREYFSSAAGAGPLVQPLLQYYGVLSLTRGLALILSPNFRETSLPQAHGLSTIGWSSHLTPEINKVSELQVKTTDGTFRMLLNLTHNSDTSVIYQAPYPNRYVISRYRGNPDLNDEVITFKQVLSRIPELRDVYERSFNEPASSLRSFVFNLSETTQTDIDIFPGRLGLISEQQLRAYLFLPADVIVRLTDRHNFLPPEPHLSFRLLHPGGVREFNTLLPQIDNDNVLGTSIICPFNSRIPISRLGRMFLLSFFLGSLARYHPTRWLAMMQGQEKGDFMLPIIRESIKVIQEKFPALVIQELEF